MKKIDKERVEQAKRIKAIKALDFLRCHPAFSTDVFGDSLFDGAWFMMTECCKRGRTDYSGKHGVTIYRGDKGWRKYEDRFEEEHKDDKDTPKNLQNIDISYEEWYGEPWKFDHVEYWYETTFFIFEGNPYGAIMEHSDYHKWGRYAGPQGGANTFEDMVINCAKKVKRAFGDFDDFKDFRLPEEIANHKEQDSFNFRDIKSGKSKGFFRMIKNKDSLDVYNGLVNVRWLKWFMTTDYCKKHWDYNMKDFEKTVKKLDKVPKKRQEILDRYK